MRCALPASSQAPPARQPPWPAGASPQLTRLAILARAAPGGGEGGAHPAVRQKKGESHVRLLGQGLPVHAPARTHPAAAACQPGTHPQRMPLSHHCHPLEHGQAPPPPPLSLALLGGLLLVILQLLILLPQKGVGLGGFEPVQVKWERAITAVRCARCLADAACMLPQPPQPTALLQTSHPPIPGTPVGQQVAECTRIRPAEAAQQSYSGPRPQGFQ